MALNASTTLDPNRVLGNDHYQDPTRTARDLVGVEGLEPPTLSL